MKHTTAKTCIPPKKVGAVGAERAREWKERGSAKRGSGKAWKLKERWSGKVVREQQVQKEKQKQVGQRRKVGVALPVVMPW